MMLSSTFLSRMRHLGSALMLPVTIFCVTATPGLIAKGQTGGSSSSLTLRSDIQEANSQTGVITARGNVQIFYPARQIQATAAQAQYFSREHRIVLSGNVYILQHGNSIRGETVTYLIDQGEFVAVPKTTGQVESIYIVVDPNNPSAKSPSAPATPPLKPKAASK